MTTQKASRKFLTLAIMATVLTPCSSWAATTTETVDFLHNLGTPADPYTSITVTKDSSTTGSPPVFIPSLDEQTSVKAGILLDPDKNAALTVYLGSNSTIAVDSRTETGTAYSAAGIVNNGRSAANILTVTAAGPITITAQAQNNNQISPTIEAYGIFNGYSNNAGGNIIFDQNATITATAQNDYSQSLYTVAAGIMSSNSLTAKNIKATVRAAASSALMNGAYGIFNVGTATLGDVDLTTYAENTLGHTFSIGLLNKGQTLMTVQNVKVKSDAVNKETTRQQLQANSGALWSSGPGSIIMVQGDVQATATLTNSDSNSYGFATAVIAQDSAENYLNVTASGTPLGKKVQLTGDVAAKNNGVNNIILSGSSSYLQGNIRNTLFKETGIGTNNITFTDGAVWQPVYDNRNHSFVDFSDPATWKQGYQVTTNNVSALTLSNGGIVDLTWDNEANGKRSGVFRTLSIDTLKGDGGVFKINSDLAGSKADQIVLGQGTTTTAANVTVKYDPYLDTAGLKKGNGLSGNAVVFSGAGVGSLASVTGVQDSYNLYSYTPTFAKNIDGTWSLTGLNIDKPLPAGPASGHVKSAGQDRLAFNDLFLVETNSLSKRLGELRNDVDAEHGVWARYNDGKLEQGHASLKANLFQAGYDKGSIGYSEHTYRGAALSYAKGNGTYELGSGDVKETTLSLYQTGIKNDGRYYDVVLKAGKYMNDYSVTNTANPSSADYSSWAYSISGEVGKRIQLGKGLYVEPQAELILGRLNGADYTTSTGMKVNLDAQNKALTRLGLAFGKSYDKGSLYGRFSYYHDFGSGVDLTAASDGASVGYSEDMARNWTELTLGGDVKLSKAANLYAEVSKYMGQLTSNIRYNIGARWSF